MCQTGGRCTTARGLTSCPHNPFRGRLVKAGAMPTFTNIIPDGFFAGRPAAGIMVGLYGVLARKYGFSLRIDVSPSGRFSPRTREFSPGSYRKVRFDHLSHLTKTVHLVLISLQVNIIHKLQNVY